MNLRGGGASCNPESGCFVFHYKTEYVTYGMVVQQEVGNSSKDSVGLKLNKSNS